MTLGKVSLVGRLMTDVVGDLESSGLTGRCTCLPVDYDEGFTLGSLGELMPQNDAGATDPRTVVEGVAISTLARRSESAIIRGVECECRTLYGSRTVYFAKVVLFESTEHP